MSPCPTADDWEALTAGHLDERAADDLLRHAATCAACRAVHDGMKQNEALVGPLREALSGAAAEGPLTLVGRRFGRYAVRAVLGTGGMATVYEAEQDHPRRMVALKVMARWLAAPSARARFQQEAELFGRLHHPGIAQVYESGTQDDGGGPRPFFAMEIVRGPTLTDYAAAHKLTVPQRLDLIAQVCDAVQHAHEQGVIHRDLKPSNILVDERGRAKVLDFGVARATESDLKTTTLRTDIGQLVGTVSYMSPEQAAGDPDSIGPPTDVYALGVVCFELLTGRPPYDVRSRPLHEAVRIIRDQEPRTLDSFDRSLRGDPATIIATALEKEPQRRYPSAAALAADILRYLAHEPITAHPASVVYQARKFARRNRALVGGLAAVFAALILGLAGTSYGLLRARHQAGLALAAQRQAEQQGAEADRRRAAAEAVTAMMERMLRSTNPHEAKGSGYTVRQLLDDSARTLGHGLEDQPEVEGSLRATVGNAYRMLGEYALAQTHLDAALARRRAAFGDEHPLVARSITDRAWLLHDQADYAGAETQFIQAAAMQRRLPGDQRADLATSLLGISDVRRHAGKLDEALAPGQEALALRSAALGPAHPDVGECLINLAKLARERGDDVEASTQLSRAIDLWRASLGEEHPRLIDAFNERAWLAYQRRDYDSAESELRRAVEMGRKLLGNAHPDLANGLYELAMTLAATNRRDEAEASMREALAIYRAAHGNEHPSVCTTLDGLARLVSARGDRAEAESLVREAIAIRTRLGSDPSAEQAIGLTTLAGILKSKGDTAGAETAWRQAIAMNQAVFKGDHRNTAVALYNLSQMLADQGRDTDAAACLGESVRINRTLLGPDHADTLFVEAGLARLLIKQQDFAQAEPLLRRLVQAGAAGKPSQRHAANLILLGQCLKGLERYAEAEQPLKDGIAILQSTPGQAATQTTDALRDLAALYDAWGKPTEAAAIRTQLAPAPTDPR